MSNQQAADDFGPYGTQVTDHPSKERTLQNALRGMTFVAVTLGFTNAASLWVLASVFPLQQVQPFLVQFSDKKDQIVRVEPAEIDGKAYAQMTEFEVRDFVSGRHAIPATKPTEVRPPLPRPHRRHQEGRLLGRRRGRRRDDRPRSRGRQDHRARDPALPL